MTQRSRNGATSRRAPPPPIDSRTELSAAYREARAKTELLCAPLKAEDCCIQSMPDVSPPKWHLAHTAWFFEAFVLGPYSRAYTPYHPAFHHLFNSYYETVGKPYPRARRGLLSRPTVEEVADYRYAVDRAIDELIDAANETLWPDIRRRIELGIQHEQQHQELLLTDVKHILAQNPLRPSYLVGPPMPEGGTPTPLEWLSCPGGIHEIGCAGPGFAFDNETPRHRTYLRDYDIASRLVTNVEYMAFIDAGGYEKPELWLSEGWRTVCEQAWRAPLYWEYIDGSWWHMTLHGMQPVLADEPVCHVSFYEADAYARWTGNRLPTEQEWEVAASTQPPSGNFLESGWLRPRPAPTDATGPAQLFGDVWEWTASPYSPYPGFRPLAGSLGEYNGKFMCNQMVLRGGSCATPAAHIRASYRNFFYPADRWQFSGLRLAQG